MRLFAAIDIPEEVRGVLGSAAARWKPLAKISWSPIDNLHITTKFIGEWPEARLDELRATLGAVPATGAIRVAIRGIGWFPDERRPRVLWAGVQADESLAKLAHATDQAVAALGVPVEKRSYSPHLTLARIRDGIADKSGFSKSGPLDALRAEIAKANPDFGAFRAAQHTLYLSAGGRYTPLASFTLESLVSP
jgi:RNA 2',3'-cyclic 3'-phosphodiesterase